jgi:flagellin-like hook-associated protein FlgL
MASNIVLSAGVRQNLLALQNTADLMSLTQNRLATGKKVNSALDNPTSFFTSQALSDRANDLSALLDSIGQAQQTLNAANQGITSLQALVANAKSIAQQARQIDEPQVNYAQIDETGNVDFNETIGSTTGSAAVTNLGVGDGGNLVITVGSNTFTVALADGDSLAQVESKINAVTGNGAGGANKVIAGDDGSGHLTLTAANSDVDFTISNTSDAATLTALGLTGGTAVNSSNLLDLSSGLVGKTLTVQANGGAAKTIVFGNAGDQVSTFAELQAALAGTGVTASLTVNGSAENITLSVAGTTNGVANSLSLSGTATGSGAGTIGIAAVTSEQGTSSSPVTNQTRANYQQQYNEILTQIDALTKDSVYNGINLLHGDQLKVVFNELNTSSVTIQGVTFDSAGLGLQAISGTGFQSNANIDATLTTIDQALTTLRTQASNFGSTLTTVQTRQDFIKNLTTILETGSDQLVTADTNQEGANMLALQTRQQLSTTALSLASQADQAVLRLFG